MADVPGPVENLVLLAVPDAALEEQLILAARRGDRSAVIFGNAHEAPTPNSSPSPNPGLPPAQPSPPNNPPPTPPPPTPVSPCPPAPRATHPHSTLTPNPGLPPPNPALPRPTPPPLHPHPQLWSHPPRRRGRQPSVVARGGLQHAYRYNHPRSTARGGAGRPREEALRDLREGGTRGQGTGSLRERLAAIARAAGMQLCGAGCMGFVNVARGLRAIGYTEPDPLPAGPVALVTHSGSVFSAMLRARRGIGYSLAVSSGQELVTAGPSYLDYALGLPETKVLALVLEAIREPERLRQVLARAAERDIPVVLLTAGQSASGRMTVNPHSGAWLPTTAAGKRWLAPRGAPGRRPGRARGHGRAVRDRPPRRPRARDRGGDRDRARLRTRTCPRGRPGRGHGRAVRRHRRDHQGPAGGDPRPGPGPGQPARCVGHRGRHQGTVLRVADHAGRGPVGLRGRARR